MHDPSIEDAYLLDVLKRLLEIPSPTGMTDAAIAVVCGELEVLDIPFELTRRGAIRATLSGTAPAPDRAIVSHLDTLGAMVKDIRANGRVEMVPIGTWSARFAEGARVTIHSDDALFRGTILPLKASGHAYNEEVDEQPSAWTNLEVRLDAHTTSSAETRALGIAIGDTIAIDPQPEFGPNGFINSRHLDDKAGVATVLAAARAVRKENVTLPIDCHLLFTLSEEVGVGASAVLAGDVAELVSVDNGTIAPGQNTSPYGVTIAMQDSSGPVRLAPDARPARARRQLQHRAYARRVPLLPLGRGVSGGSRQRHPRRAGLLRARRQPRLGTRARTVAVRAGTAAGAVHAERAAVQPRPSGARPHRRPARGRRRRAELKSTTARPRESGDGNERSCVA